MTKNGEQMVQDGKAGWQENGSGCDLGARTHGQLSGESRRWTGGGGAQGQGYGIPTLRGP